MTDICERLRTSASSDDMLWRADLQAEAADMIEHLRSVNKKLLEGIGAARIGPSFSEISKDLPRREIDHEIDARLKDEDETRAYFTNKWLENEPDLSVKEWPPNTLPG